MVEMRMGIWKRSDGKIRVMVTSENKQGGVVLNRRQYWEKFANHLKNAKPFDRMDIIINSTGGMVDSAIGMVMALEMIKKPTRILIEGNCGSAATLLLEMSCPVYMTENSAIYTHRPSRQRFQINKKTGEEKIVNTESYGMRRMKMYFRETYMIRTKRNKKKHKRKEIKQWIEEGRRFTAKEAVEAGMADGLMSRVDFEKG